jgi:integrase
LCVRENAPQIGGEVVLGRPKTKAGERPVSLDAGTVEALRAHRKRQLAQRLAWGNAYEDNDLVFAREDGSMEMPERVSRRFKQLAREAGLPPIKLHGGRHTAASLALEAGVAMKVVSDQLGHSTTAITSDLYTHVYKVVRDDAADRVAALLNEHATVVRLRDEAAEH